MLKSFQEKMKIYDQNFLYLIRKFCKKKIARGKTFLCSNTYPPPILNPYLLPMGKGKKKVQFVIAFSQNFSQFNNFFLSYFHLVHKSMQERSKGGVGKYIPLTYMINAKFIYFCDLELIKMLCIHFESKKHMGILACIQFFSGCLKAFL